MGEGENGTMLATRPFSSAELTAGINRFLENGIREYRKRDLCALGAGDWQRIKTTLDDWEDRGITRIMKAIDKAEDDDVVIEMLKYVDTDDGFKWPPLPPKTA